MPRSLAFLHPSWLLVVAAASLAACATGTIVVEGGGGGSSGDGGGGGAAPTASSGGQQQGAQSSASGGQTTGGGGVARDCPPGEFLKSIDSSGALSCGPIDAATREGVNTGCSVYFGQRDTCSGCSLPPTKWGSVGGDTCAIGAGADSTCAAANLGGKDMTLFGLNLDGDVNADDKLYLGFSCGEGSVGSTPGPCGEDKFATGINGASLTCSPASGSVLGYVRERCSLYFGQRDSCNGCEDPPVRWGSVGTTACDPGVGVGNTCTTVPLGGVDVNLFGLDLDGDGNNDDKYHLGMRCAPPEEATSVGKGSCPDGQLVAGIQGDGSLRCVSPAPVIAAFVADHCAVTFGFRDSCDGCVNPPAKWGRVRSGSCELGVGVDDTCSSATLGSDEIKLFGLNADGDVDGNDKLYIGLRCD
jgi:hypothetical protein